MKTILFLILLCASAYGADVTTTNIAGDITTVVSERRDDAGKPEFRAETLYRGKEKILLIFSHPNKEGKMVVTSRAYMVEGKMIMGESDEGGDGKFEHFMVYVPDTDNFEMFTRHPDGTVTPASTKTIELAKKENAVAHESLKKLIQSPEMSDQEISKLLQENRQKIEDLQKQEKNDKKPSESPSH